MPPKRRNRKSKGPNHNKSEPNRTEENSKNGPDEATTQNSKKSQKNSKKLKKMDLRGPHWKANLDYITGTPAEKKKNFPVIKGTQAFDLQREYQHCYKKFMGNYGNQLNELTEILKTPIRVIIEREEEEEIIEEEVESRKSLDDAKFLSVDEKLNLLNQFIAKLEDSDKISSLPKMLNRLGYSTLHHICEPENNDPEILDWFLDTFSSIDIRIDTQNRFLQTPLHIAVISGLVEHVKILITHNADPRIITVDGYNGVDLAKLHLPKEIEMALEQEGEQEKQENDRQKEAEKSKQARIEILNLVESAINDIEELERDTNNLNLEFSDVPTYPEKVQKYLLVNGHNMQVETVDAFSKHLDGDMSKIQEAHDKRIVVKIQKPSLGEGMCLVSTIDKKYYSFIMPDHVMYKKLTSMIEELTDNGIKAYFYATPFDEWHLVLHDIFAPQQSW